MVADVKYDDRRKRYVVTNPAGQSVFVYDFPIDSTDTSTGIDVYVDDELLDEADYTVDEAASEVTLDTAAAENSIVVLEGATLAERELSYPLRGGLPSPRLNREAQKFFYMLQEILRDTSRSFKLPPSAGDDFSTDAPEYEAGAVLGWDPLLKKLVNYVPNTAAYVSASAFMSALLSVGDAWGARVYLEAQTRLGEVDVASAATLDLSNLSSYERPTVRITGGVTITSFGTIWPGTIVTGRFATSLTLTHGTNLVLPTGANIITQADDTFIAKAVTASKWLVLAYTRANGQSLAAFNPRDNDFRLTLTSGTPVTVSDVTGATTLYCTPYKGNRIALYDGSKWVLRTANEFSLALGTLTSGRPYDVFCYDNAGTPTLELTAWTNDSTRATALTRQDGVLVKSGALTRRYLGTFYTTSTTATEDSAAKRYLYNYYHRAKKLFYKTDATASWNYTTGTYRQANASAANQVEFIQGVAEDAVDIAVSALVKNSSASLIQAQVGIGLDSTSAIATGVIATPTDLGVANAYFTTQAKLTTVPNAGRHYAAWLEVSVASGTATWTATATSGAVAGGITGNIMV